MPSHKVLEHSYPPQITPRPEWTIIDSTKLNAAQTCMRKYFYEHTLGWKPDWPNIHLHFGSSFHIGMEHLTLNKDNMSDAIIAEAFSLFLEEYRRAFSEEDDLKNAPKNPENCLKAFMEYAETYKDDNFRVLYTEVVGSASIDEDHAIHFKIDAMCEGPEGIFCLEHKTTGADSKAWREQWRLALQPGTYTHALYSLFPMDDVFGVKINGIILRKMGNAFARIPIRKTESQMQAWLWNTRRLISELEFAYEELSRATEDDQILTAFPMNTTSCTMYNSVCPYLDFCDAWPNPLQRCSDTPIGYKNEIWDPRKKEEEGARFKVEDGQIKELGTCIK